MGPGIVDIDAIIIAGGRGRRLGGRRWGDKARFPLHGVRLIDVVAQALPQMATVIGVGPPVDDVVGVVRWVQECPIGGGPVAAIRAGFDALGPGRRPVAVIAGDMPRIGFAIGPLGDALDASEPGIAVAVVCTDRPQWLASLWRRPALAQALANVVDAREQRGGAVRDLYSTCRRVEIPDDGSWTHDIDTIDDTRVG